MARVLSTGGIVTICNMDALFPEAPRTDPNILNLSVRLFAVLDTGQTAVDPLPQSMGWASGLDQMRTTAQLEEAILGGLRSSTLPTGHRRAYWQRIVDELAKFGVNTDPETLQALPFEVLPTRAVRDLLEDMS